MTATEPKAPPKHYALSTKMALKSDYIQGKGSLRDLAIKHSVAETRAYAWSKEEKWGPARKAWIDAQDRRLNAPPEPMPAQPLIVQETPQSSNSRVDEINKRIDEVTGAMADAVLPKDVQALSMALDRLYNIWSLLTGHPRPGVRKEVKGRSKVTYAQPQDQ